SYFDLLPKNDPLVLEYQENQIYLSTTDSVVLLVTLVDPGERTRTEREAALQDAGRVLAETLRGNPEFKSVTYLIEPAPDIPDQYILLYQLGSERLAEVEASVAIARSAFGEVTASLPPTGDLSTAYREMSAVIDEVAASGLAFEGGAAADLGAFVALNDAVLQGIDRLETFPEITLAVRRIADLFAPQADVVREGRAFFSRDGNSLLVSVKPHLPAQTGVEYCDRIRAAIDEDLARVDLDGLGVRIAVAGLYTLIAETDEVVSADMHRTELVTAAGVVLVFLVSFGSLLYSLIASIPLLVALLATSAWTKAGLGGFNLITTFVPSLILGMGDDFAIHLISRYVEERTVGGTFSRAVFTMLARKGSAIFLGASTIVLVFLGLLSARSRALFEMGAIASVGIALAFAFAVVTIPALLTQARKLRGKRRRRERAAHHAPHFVAFFRVLTSRVGSTVIVVSLCGLTVVAGLLASGVRFAFSSNDLIPRVSSQDALDQILTSFDLGGESAQLGTNFLFFATSEAEMAWLGDALAEHPLVLAVDSAQQYLPANLAEQQAALRGLRLELYADQLAALDRSLAARDAVLAEVRTLWTRLALVQYAASLNGYAKLGLDAAQSQAQLLEIQERLAAMDVERERSAVQELEAAVRELDVRLADVRDLPPAEKLLRDILRSLPSEIETRYITTDGRYIVRARMSPTLFAKNNLREFVQFADGLSSDYFGVPLAVRELESVMKRDFYISTVIAFVLIAFTVWHSFRKIWRTLLALSPVFFSYVWMLGGMRLLGVNFNFINIAISPLLVGLGIESGVSLLFRYDEERAKDPDGAMIRAGSTTLAAITTSLFTTMLVFGSLLAARTPGLRFLGTCALLGLGSSLFFSVVFVPAATTVFRRRSRPRSTTP
ncbi:MAG: MMPL family transporter, partial [Candidatus Bipolaricaulota bacterium]